MLLNEFIEIFDKAGAIVLLEGKRDVSEADKDKLIALGKLLAQKTSKMLFRSGNADGADQFFSEAVASVDHKRLEVITPYTGHRKKTNQAYTTYFLEDMNLNTTKYIIDILFRGYENRYKKSLHISKEEIKLANNVEKSRFYIYWKNILCN